MASPPSNSDETQFGTPSLEHEQESPPHSPVLPMSPMIEDLEEHALGPSTCQATTPLQTMQQRKKSMNAPSKSSKKSLKKQKYSGYSIDPTEFSSEEVIQLVQERPSLWDKENQRHSDIVYNRKMWDQVYIALFPDFMKYGSKLQKAINGNSWEIKSNVTLLLVQPVTISLLKRLFTWTESTMADQCLPFKVPETDQIRITLNINSVHKYKEVSNSIGFLRGSILPDRYIILGSTHADVYETNTQEWISGAASMTSIISSIMLKVKNGWRPSRTIIFCSWEANPFGNFGSYKWGKDLQKILASNAVAYIGLQSPVGGNASLHSVSSPSLQQLSSELAKKMQITCAQKEACYKANISSIQVQGDADFFINQLGIPAAQFAFADNKAKIPHIFSEVLFNNEKTSVKEMNDFFHLNEYAAKITSEMVLRIASDPVLPFNALDIALEVQKRIEGNDVSTDLIEMAKHLRETAELFQSNEMRPANDPKERDPIRVRMLNDILQNMEKNFLLSSSPPGFFRNVLYRLDETSTRFSILQEAQEHSKITKSNETLMTALQEVLNCINSAQLYFKEGLHLFEFDVKERD